MRRAAWIALLVFGACNQTSGPAHAVPSEAEPRAQERIHMVRRQIEARGLRIPSCSARGDGGEGLFHRIVEPLAQEAIALLSDLGYGKRVRLRHGDGYVGWAERAPFDAIIVTAAPPVNGDRGCVGILPEV